MAQASQVRQHMSTALRHRYLAAVLSIVAVWTATAVWPGVPRPQLLLGAILFSGAWGGLGPGLTTVALGSAARWLWPGSHVYLVPQMWLPLEGAIIVVVIAALHQARVRAERRHAAAEDETKTAKRDVQDLRAAQDALVASEQNNRRLFQESRDLERQMRQAQKMEAVGRLAGGIAHDFNNLLTAITGYTELLISNMSPTDVRIQDAYEVRRAALSAARLTKQLLAISRQQRTNSEILNVNAVVAQTAGLLKRTLGDDVGVTLRLDPDLANVKADPAHVEQIVMNLAVNARDAMPAGGHLTIATAMHRIDAGPAGLSAPGDYVRLTVADTGSGIPEALQSRVFEPFFTTKGAGGTGIGLATVYGIVKQAGGYIRFDSVEGHGTTFIIDLPSTTDAAPAVTSATEPPRFVEGFGTVLVVDDDQRIREVTELVLRRAGHDVVLASGPHEALAAIRGRTDINLLLTDVVMPEMSGYDLAAEVRKVAPGVRCVFMSGFESERFLGLSADPFLGKPFTIESLTSAVQEAIATA
jgi:signal transduction histidine kinase